MHSRHEQYDAVVIGSGQAGVSLATELARAGLNTALLDEESSGCTGDLESVPSRSLIASANMARLARRAGNFGVETGAIAVDLAKVQLRRQALESFCEPASPPPRNVSGLSILRGAARFTGNHVLLLRDAAAEREVSAARIVINTGARSVLPDVRGLAGVAYLTARSAMEVDELPAHLLVLGGGYRGVELAQVFRRFGSRVSIVERHSQLLVHEDRDVAAVMAEMLREDGVEIFLETEAVAVRADSAGVQLSVRTSSGEHELCGSRLLVIAGRQPNTESLDLAAAGITVSSGGYIEVNERLETSAPGVYAMGGVTGAPAFPNVVHDDMRTMRANVIDPGEASPTRRLRPYTVFTNPQLARIGITESEARGRGLNVRVAKMPMRRSALAQDVSESGGLIKIVIDRDSGRVAGAAALGVDSGEIMATLQIAMMTNMTYAALREGVMAHPTLTGSLDRLFATPDPGIPN